MPNYQNSKIYELICSETGLKYIGSTTQKLCQRLSQHKIPSNRCASKTLINPKIYLIENNACNSKEELHAIERKFIESNECVNKVIPGRTDKEWRDQNKESLTLKKKEYRESHKDKNKEYSQEYFQNNKELLLKRQKEYREKNREKINEKKKEKFNCDCGGHYCRSGKSYHLKSKKHIKYINSINIE